MVKESLLLKVFEIDNMMVIQSTTQFHPQLSKYERTLICFAFRMLLCVHSNNCLDIPIIVDGNLRSHLWFCYPQDSIKCETLSFSTDNMFVILCTNSFPLRTARVNAFQILVKRECLLIIFIKFLYLLFGLSCGRICVSITFENVIAHNWMP